MSIFLDDRTARAFFPIHDKSHKTVIPWYTSMGVEKRPSFPPTLCFQRISIGKTGTSFTCFDDSKRWASCFKQDIQKPFSAHCRVRPEDLRHDQAYQRDYFTHLLQFFRQYANSDMALSKELEYILSLNTHSFEESSHRTFRFLTIRLIQFCSEISLNTTVRCVIYQPRSNYISIRERRLPTVHIDSTRISW